MMKYLTLLALSDLFLLTGCASSSPGGPTAAQMTALVTCGSEAAAVSTLADLTAAGKLTKAQIEAVRADIALVDPVCSLKDPSTIVSTAGTAAAQDLITLAGSIH